MTKKNDLEKQYSNKFWENEKGTLKRRKLKSFEDLMRSSEQISVDVGIALGEYVDDLDTTNHEFKRGLYRVFLRVLTIARQKSEKVVVFHEAIPGFTMMLFKKEPLDDWAEQIPSKAIEDDLSAPTPDSPEGEAASMMINQFFKRTGNRVLMVETEDSLILFFPVQDVKKNLREMGFYFVDHH